MNLRPGDILLSRGNGWLASAIRFFTRRIGESRTKVNHVGIVVALDGTMVEAVRKVEIGPLVERYHGQRVAIYRPIGLADETLVAIARKAESYVGREYGWLKIALHAMDWALQGAYVFRRLGRMDRYPICSYLVAHAYASVGLDFGVEPGAATPDDIWDFVTTRRDKYECIHPLGVL